MSTAEQREYRAVLQANIAATGRRYRVKADGEGYPVTPGRYGHVEYCGGERLTVYSDRRLVIPKLRALFGLVPVQVGDTEARFAFPAGSPDTLEAVCGVIRARIRRAASTGRYQKAT